MEFKLCLVGTIVLCLSLVQHASSSTKALLECGRVHQIDNIANLSTATASYSNSRCMLVCVIGSAILPVDSIHEGQSCPEDTNGICRAGQCIGGQEDALRECGLRHSVDFHKVDNHQGTAFTHDQCALRCVLGGIELPVSHMHEGESCPANRNGICRSGSCVAQSTNPGLTVTPIPPTTPKQQTTITIVPPTTVTQPSISSFSPSKMKLLNISLEATEPSLNEKQQIILYFYETFGTLWMLCHFDGNQTMKYYCYTQTINDIPSKLMKESKIYINMIESDKSVATDYEDLYPLFTNFYQNHKLAFGEQENFVAKFQIQPNGKLMGVSLGFTIVFSKS